MDRSDILQLATTSDVENLNIATTSISDSACALLGYQRTKQISRKARRSWEAGSHDVLRTEVRERRSEIITGALLEIYQEYLPLQAALTGHDLTSVCDIGCGQGINNIFLQHDHSPHFTLIDIETTEDQYHFWSENGSGYASLEAARTLLRENGVPDDKITTINPTRTPWPEQDARFDLVTSLYSCGFHYPIDEYLDVFVTTLGSGGAVCLDLRRHYLNSGSEALSRLSRAASGQILYEDPKSLRMLYRAAS